MNTIRRKLRSDRGSSMVLALFLMLVAVMVSHTILAAAATAGQNVVQQRESQQAYLTVSSAAETFRDSVLSFNGDNSFRQVVETRYSDASMEHVTQTTTSYNSLQGPFSVELEGYEDVSMELSLEKDAEVSGNGYVLNAVFSNAVPGKPIPDAPCRMKVTIRAYTESLKDETSQDKNNVWVRRTVRWQFTSAEIVRADTVRKEAGT